MRTLIAALLITTAIFVTSCCPRYNADDFGYMSGPIRTEWLDTSGRQMELLETVIYIDQYGQVWEAPRGWIVDGSSIPKIFWTLVASPFVGQHRVASVFHDVACDRKVARWQDVHRMYYSACRKSGVSESQAKLLFAAVWLGGPRWEDGITRYALRSSSSVERHAPILSTVQQAIEEDPSISLDEIILLLGE